MHICIHTYAYVYMYVYINNDVTRPGLPALRVACRPGRPWAPRLARSGRFGRAWPPRTARSKSLERPKLSDKAARASPTSHCRRFGVDFGFGFQCFSQFFDVPWRGSLDSLRTGPNLRFCWQAQYFRGFAGSAKTRKIEKTR